MNFRREQIKDYYLLDTDVQNIFINEYMASAPGDYVKVYLFSLMYADLEQEMTGSIVAKQLGLSEEDVLKAWSYWEGMGVIRKIRSNPEDKFNYQVEFINLKELLYGKAPKKKSQQLEESTKVQMADKDIQSMYNSIERVTGKVISGAEMMEILSWINDFHATPEVIVYAYSYCKTKNKQNVRYVAAVVKGWTSEGLFDVVAVEDYLKETDQRHYLYKRVCKALGFARNATEEEKKIMDGWFDTMGYTIDKVLEACGKTSGISNPNINYVNTILTNWYKESQGMAGGTGRNAVSIAVVNQYYDYLRKTEETEAQQRRQEVYEKLPRIGQIEEEINLCRMKVSRTIVSERRDKEEEIKRLQDEIYKLNSEKAILLTDHNFQVDYLDIYYKCDVCKDTGMTDEGTRCECFQLRTKEAEIWQKNLK